MGEDLSIVNDEVHDEYMFMSFVGSINMDTCDTIAHKIVELSKQASPLNYIFDFGKVDFLSSSGIEVFLTVLNDADDKEGTVVLVNMPPEVQRIFSLVGLLEEFKEAATKEEALKLIE